MNTIRCLSIVAGIFAMTGFSQVIGPPTVPGPVDSSAPASASPPKTPGTGVASPGLLDSNLLASVSPLLADWQATPQDANSTEWHRVRLVLNPQTGQLEFHTNNYTELANNLNFINALGALEPSADSIQLMTNTGGAAALKSPTRVYFPPTIGGAGDDPLTFVSASNTVLKIKPLALYYFDAQSGKSVLLASAQQAQGELIGVNQVVYKSIFKGCDLRITYTKAACESDLIMLARPKPPEAFALNRDYTRLELWHAVDGPAPVQAPTIIDSVTDPAARATMAEPDFVDNTLDFQDLHFPQGRAFSWNSPEEQGDPNVPVQVHSPGPSINPGEVVVAKSWQQIGQTTVLVESVQWTNIEPALAGLPLMAQAKGGSEMIQHASLKRQMPELGTRGQKPSKPIKMALAPYKAKGFLLDYVVISGGFGSPYTFSNQTYFVNGIASFGPTVNFNAGCCLKYTNGAYISINYASINCYGNSSSNSILTSMNDNAVGETIVSSSGYPSYDALPALYLQNAYSINLNWMKVRWAQQGIEWNYGPGSTNTVSNSSFEWCQTAQYAYNTVVSIQNSTQCSVQHPTIGSGTFYGSLANICIGNDPANGLPYSWEYEYFAKSGISASADPDADGLSNQQEYTMQMNPQVCDSPTILPQNPLVAQGNNITFLAVVARTSPQSYQWSFNGVNIAGATTSTYSLTNIQLANCGNYAVSASYSNVWTTPRPSTFLSVAVPSSGTPAPAGIIAWWPGNNPLNHLISVNTNGVVLTYDGDGNRTKKTVGSTTTYYVLDDRNPSGYVQVLEEWTNTTGISRVYNYGLQLISQRQINTSTNYFILDGHGSTRVLVDAGTNVANAFAFDAYGILISSNTTPQTVYLYCGQQWDPDIGIYYNRARYYQSGTGRFWTLDTVSGDQEDPLSLHKYLYGRDDPVSNSDPRGTTWETDFGRAVEQVIRDDFFSKDPNHRFDTDVSLARLLGKPYSTPFRQRVDLAHKDNKDNFFFEIKHGTPTEIAKGFSKILSYNSILNASAAWRPGTMTDYVYQNGVLPIITTDRNGRPLPGGKYALVLPPAGGLITYIRISPMTPKVVLNALAALGASSALFSLEVGAPAAEVTAANITISSLATTATASSQIGAIASADIGIGYATATATATLGGPVP